MIVKALLVGVLYGASWALIYKLTDKTDPNNKHKGRTACIAAVIAVAVEEILDAMLGLS